MMRTAELYNFSHSLAGEWLSGFEWPWQALGGIKEEILRIGAGLGDDYEEISPQVWVHKTAVIAQSASIGAPCIIGPGTEVRHGAFIRGSALVGADCVVGNSVELKNVILFDKVQVPHYNYVGDSILGWCAHMGAGSITSNVKGDKSLVVIHGEPSLPTGLKKVGAFLGDRVEVGCNSVLNPGTVIGRDSQVYPLTSVRGVIPPRCLVKGPDAIVAKNA